MSANRNYLAALLAALLAQAVARPALAKGDDDEDEETVTVDDGDGKPSRAIKKKPKKEEDDDGLQKQDLSGHALGTTKKENLFERDRFYVDKTDSEKTEKGTLVQGSLAATAFAYHESGGNLTVPTMGVTVPSNSPLNRLYTDLRLQTDFRHIGASRWDARLDVRGRVANNPGSVTAGWDAVAPTDSHIQAGWQGKQELEVKEAWLVRNGVRSDVFLGRQYVQDLGGVKIDGLRVDYASSTKFTMLGFGGLYPIRGSRSIFDDYTALKANPDANGARGSAGKLTAAGGFGAAYRTQDAYGAFGGVVLAPLSSESPRVYGTSTGYWRTGPKLDIYHFVILDLVGSSAVNTGLTNLSAGLNYKPDQRLRMTASFNRVDTETLNVQAQAFLNNPEVTSTIIQNESYIQRIATNEARGSVSAGLGELQRFEVTAAATFRYRGEVTLAGSPAVTPVTLPKAQSVEVYGAITDRRSFKDLRLGVDGSRTFGVGDNTYQRTKSLNLRVSASRALANGHGEWEAEVAYATTEDDNAGVACGDVLTCFGAAKSNILSVGGNLYYRINRDWFALGSLFINRTSITHVDMAGSVDDPAIVGLSGYARVAYRF